MHNHNYRCEFTTEKMSVLHRLLEGAKSERERKSRDSGLLQI